jgi:hypothetical protein
MRAKARARLSCLCGFSGLCGFFSSKNETNQINQTDHPPPSHQSCFSRSSRSLPDTQNTTTHRSHKHHAPFVGSSSIWNREVREEEDETHNEAEADQRALYVLWRSFRLPTHQWTCTPPPRLTSVPVNVPLTEASAQLQDNRPSREVNRWRGV